MQLRLIDDLLRKAIMKTGLTNSTAVANATAVAHKTRFSYILAVLAAPAATQAAVRTRCLASSSIGQKQLAGLLTIFATLTPTEKVNFIKAYKVRAALTGGIRYISAINQWPPRPPGTFEP